MEGCCSSTGLSVMSLKGEFTRLVWLVFGRGLGCRLSYEGLRKGYLWCGEFVVTFKF